MSPALIIYLIELIDNFGTLLAIIFILTMVAIVVLGMSWYMAWDNDDEDMRHNLKKWIKIVGTLLAAVSLLGLVIPSKNSMYLMASAHYLNNSDMPHKVLEVLNSKLDEMISTKKEGK